MCSTTGTSRLTDVEELIRTSTSVIYILLKVDATIQTPWLGTSDRGPPGLSLGFASLRGLNSAFMGCFLERPPNYKALDTFVSCLLVRWLGAVPPNSCTPGNFITRGRRLLKVGNTVEHCYTIPGSLTVARGHLVHFQRGTNKTRTNNEDFSLSAAFPVILIVALMGQSSNARV